MVSLSFCSMLEEIVSSFSFLTSVTHRVGCGKRNSRKMRFGSDEAQGAITEQDIFEGKPGELSGHSRTETKSPERSRSSELGDFPT